jgi:galactokinase
MDEADLRRAFAAAFGQAPRVRGDAPGRVNLIGEHTDYHQGFVLPMILPQRTVIHLQPVPHDRIRVLSLAMGAEVREYAVGTETVTGTWIDYVQGVTWVLGQHGFSITGADLLIDSTLPPGAGVSSSAALQVSLLRTFRAAFALPLDDVTIARLAHEAETRFVGAAVGMMDQMACSVGRTGMAVFLDTRTLDVELVPIPATLDLAAIDSGITHRHAGGDYAERRRESFAAAAALGVSYLRDVGPADMPAIDRLPPLLRRRARHIVLENQRVLAAVEALKAADSLRLGALFNQSHASMRDDYQTSVPDIDALVSLAQSDDEAYGARMTGGGFGGAIVIATHPGAAHAVAIRVLKAYERRVKRSGGILLPQGAGGPRVGEPT